MFICSTRRRDAPSSTSEEMDVTWPRCLVSWGFGLLAVVSTLAWSTPADAETTLRLWHSYRGAERDALEQVVSTWETSQPKTTVDMLAVPHEAYARKLTASIPRGQGPDLFIHAHDRIGDWADSGLIAPIGGEERTTGLEPFLPFTREVLRYNGQTWGWPLAFKSIALFYNRDLVDEIAVVEERDRFEGQWPSPGLTVVT